MIKSIFWLSVDVAVVFGSSLGYHYCQSLLSFIAFVQGGLTTVLSVLLVCVLFCLPEKSRVEYFKDLNKDGVYQEWTSFYIELFGAFVLLNGLLLKGSVVEAVVFFVATLIGVVANLYFKSNQMLE